MHEGCQTGLVPHRTAPLTTMPHRSSQIWHRAKREEALQKMKVQKQQRQVGTIARVLIVEQPSLVCLPLTNEQLVKVDRVASLLMALSQPRMILHVQTCQALVNKPLKAPQHGKVLRGMLPVLLLMALPRPGRMLHVQTCQALVSKPLMAPRQGTVARCMQPALLCPERALLMHKL
jgi:hypothetical protein